MKTSAVLVAVLALVLNTSAAVTPVGPHVSSLDIFRNAVGLAGASLRGVGGIISCGSAGEIVDVNFTDCENVPCQSIVGNAYRVEVDFKPHIAHEKLHLEIMLLHNGEYHPVFDGEVPNSEVDAGVEYKFGYTLRITDAYMGSSRLAFRLFGPTSGATDEICFMVLLNIVHP